MSNNTSGSIAYRSIGVKANMARLLKLAEMSDANIMLARTQATLRGATPSEIQRNVMRYDGAA